MAKRELFCPECGEPAQQEPPTASLPYSAHGMPTPAYSHLDGEPLCPVAGDGGYQPASPVDGQGRPVGGGW